MPYIAMVKLAIHKTSRLIRSLKFTASIMLIAIILNFVLSTFFNIHLIQLTQEKLGFLSKDSGNYQVLPTNEHAVLAASKLDLNFKKNVSNTRENYAYFVKLENGTKFEFGLNDQKGIMPVVRVTNKEGLYVQYAPVGFEKMRVKPEINKNVLEWYVSEGIMARYTMMSDRVKADYIVESKTDLVNYRMDFDLEHSKDLAMEDLPSNQLFFLEESGFQAFMFPEPEIYDAERVRFTGEYDLKGNTLSIVLPKKDVDTAKFPLTIDPVVVDSTSNTTISTAYGNSRKLLRDAYGNLIALFEGEDTMFKAHDSSSWTSAGYDLSVNIAGALDSAGNLHVARQSNTNTISYAKHLITRNVNNAITGIGSVIVSINLDTSSRAYRPTIIIANPGGGSGVEKVVIAWGVNSQSGDASTRGEVRVITCAVSTACGSATSWTSASSEINAFSACSDTASSGVAGFPNSITCKGAADKLFSYTSAHTFHHVTLSQMPGKSKRSPSVQLFQGDGFNSTANLNDNNASTSTSLELNSTIDYLYVGDDRQFSKLIFDIASSNLASANITAEYWNGSTWTAVTNLVDYTGNSSKLSSDGPILFDQPDDWSTTSVNSVTKYWVRLTSSSGSLSSCTVGEIYINDRNSNSLVVVAGVDATDDLRAAYIPWDEINNDRWENIPIPNNAGNGWREDAGGASSSVSDTGANWATFTNYPLSSTRDNVNSVLYVGYMSGTSVGSSNMALKAIPINKSITSSANWSDSGFPTTTEAADSVLSLTSDGSDIYLFYVLDPDTNGLVYRKCNPAGGGTTTVCDNASDWGSEQSVLPFVATTNEPTHPQAVVSKAFGDTVAIDVIYTDLLATPAVEYERQYVPLSDITVSVTSSTDDATQDTFASSYSTTSNLEVVLTKQSAMRFNNIPVSQGSRISSAYLDLKVVSTVNSDTVTILGEDADNASSLSSCCINTRTNTTSTTAITGTLSNTAYRFNVTDIIQEIVCRGASNSQPCIGDFAGSGAWASGNSMVLKLTKSAVGAHIFASYDTRATNGLVPTLHINCEGSCSTPTEYTDKNYSAGVLTLPSGSGSYSDLDHPLSASEVVAVDTDDTSYASIANNMNAENNVNAAPIFQFKVQNSNDNNTDAINAQAIVKSSIPSSSKTVYLQIYRGGSTNDWETVDSDIATAGDTDITLDPDAITTNLSEYYFSSTAGGDCSSTYTDCWTYWRIYQPNAADTGNQVLSVDYFDITYGTVVAPQIRKVQGGSQIRGGTRL